MHIYPGQPATERCKYVQPNGQIRFRVVMALYRLKRARNLSDNARFPEAAEIWNRWDRKKRVRFLSGEVRSIVAAEQGLFDRKLETVGHDPFADFVSPAVAA